MIRNTIWYSTGGINNWVSSFNKFITKKENKGIFELLYPQRESIIKGELLNPAHRAIILNLPTSSGKTLIAEYRILQALNQFRDKNKKGWIAYLVPTRALVNQIFIQFNNDLSPIGIKIEKASGAIELDGFEQNLLKQKGDETDFDILVTTYEKMNLLVRQGFGTTEIRPLVLVVIDEAHNLEDESRGLNLEMLLSTIRNDCDEANFLLMTPDIRNSNDVVNWLAGDRGKVINLELDWWQPNERVIGALTVDGRGRNYDFNLTALHTNKGTYEIGEKIPILHKENSEISCSEVKGSKIKIASYLSSGVLEYEYPIIILASKIHETYSIADVLYNNISDDFNNDEEIDLVRRFVKAELGDNFPLVKYLEKRIAIHSSALPDEIRFLIEDLMAKGKLKALVATTTIAQGINFPVSAVIISSYNYPYKGAMPIRDFWNLAGRVGRVGQKSMGWIGIASKDDKDLSAIAHYIQKASDDLISQLVDAIDKAAQYANEGFERWLWKDERWSAVFQYISHLRKQTNQLEEFITHLEQKLQRTFGYRQLPDNKKRFLREKIREYASSLTLSDAQKFFGMNNWSITRIGILFDDIDRRIKALPLLKEKISKADSHADILTWEDVLPHSGQYCGQRTTRSNSSPQAP
jgi:replicative superfamily II helicase